MFGWDGSIAPAPGENKVDGACHEMQVRGRGYSALDWTKEELECSKTACTHSMYCMLGVGLCARARRGMEGLIDLIDCAWSTREAFVGCYYYLFITVLLLLLSLLLSSLLLQFYDFPSLRIVLLS
jgi:hypothetical protein